MKKLLFVGLYGSLFVALFYTVKASFDPIAWDNFWTAMAGDYPMVWNKHIAPHLPHWSELHSSPIVLIVVAIAALNVFRTIRRNNNG